jgi:Fe-S-cluster containining protein
MVRRIVLFMAGAVLSRAFPHHLWTKAVLLEGVFDSLERDIAVFRKKTRMHCPPACGHCCTKADVQTSELEMLPMALALMRRGEADRWYEEAERRGFEGVCVFYAPEPGIDAGKCSRYTGRPLICRLFGFSANTDKYGAPRLVACSVAKATDMDLVEKVQDDVAAGRIKAPLMSLYALKVAAIDPSMANELFPVNLALKKAVDRVWVSRRKRS